VNQQATFPVPVVRLIVADGAGRVLLLRRAEGTRSGGSWSLPGGKVDYGRTVEDTVRAELKEETGLDCTAMRFLFFQDSLPSEPGAMHCLNLYFQCEVAGHVELNGESMDHTWVDAITMHRYRIAFRNEEGLSRYWAMRAQCAPSRGT